MVQSHKNVCAFFEHWFLKIVSIHIKKSSTKKSSFISNTSTDVELFFNHLHASTGTVDNNAKQRMSLHNRIKPKNKPTKSKISGPMSKSTASKPNANEIKQYK
jgi:hypothetical protein